MPGPAIFEVKISGVADAGDVAVATSNSSLCQRNCILGQCVAGRKNRGAATYTCLQRVKKSTPAEGDGVGMVYFRA